MRGIGQRAEFGPEDAQERGNRKGERDEANNCGAEADGEHGTDTADVAHGEDIVEGNGCENKYLTRNACNSWTSVHSIMLSRLTTESPTYTVGTVRERRKVR